MPNVYQLAAGAGEAQIQAVLNNLGDGDTLRLAPNETIAIGNGLIMDVSSRSATFDLNGSTLQQAGDVSVLTVRGAHAPAEAATIGRDAGGQVTVTTAGAAPAAQVGDWIKVFSDSLLPNDHGDATRLGQAMKVVAVDGNRLTLAGELVDGELYVDNIRVSAFVGGEATVENGTVQGDQGNPGWVKDLVQLRSTVDADVNHMTIRDGNAMAINVVDSAHARVSQTVVINLTDDPSDGHNGYAVHSASSTGTTVQGLYVERVRHATDDNAIGVAANDPDPSKYGADIGLTVSDVVAYDTSAAAFSWHTEGRAGTVSDSVVFNSYGVLGARGVDNAMSDVAGYGNARGIQFYEYGQGDGREISVDNVQLRATKFYGYTTTGDTADNVISNSTFETLDKKSWPATGVTTVNSQTILLANGTLNVAQTLTGTDVDDRLLAGGGNDTIQGGAGDDYIWGNKGSDLLTGGAGLNRFAYQAVEEGGDTITDLNPGEGGDIVDLSVLAIRNGWTGDIFAGGYVALVQSGDDTLVRVDADGGGDSYVTLATLRGVEAGAVRANISTEIHVTGAAPPAEAPDEPGEIIQVPASGGLPGADLYPNALRLTVNGTLTGTPGDDVLIGTALDDKLVGGDGNDTLIGGGGRDQLLGGLGSNFVSYETSVTWLQVDLQNPAMSTGDAEGDSYSGTNGLLGSPFDDRLYGSGSANTIYGRAGNDLIDGRSGADTLAGNAGNDTLRGGTENDRLSGEAGDDRLESGPGYDTMIGGEGNDVFLLNLADKQWDTIADFGPGDHVELVGFGIANLDGSRFVSATAPKATAAVGTILYDSDDGILLWDADGTGSGAAVRLAVFTGAPELGASDFLFG